MSPKTTCPAFSLVPITTGVPRREWRSRKAVATHTGVGVAASTPASAASKQHSYVHRTMMYSKPGYCASGLSSSLKYLRSHGAKVASYANCYYQPGYYTYGLFNHPNFHYKPMWIFGDIHYDATEALMKGDKRAF